MSTLARIAGPLALLGGTVWVIATVALMAIPSSFASGDLTFDQPRRDRNGR